MEQKSLDFCRKFPQGCQTSFYVSTGTFWGITFYFSGKSSFFFYHFQTMSNFFSAVLDFFDGLVITACYVSKHISKKNIFISKKKFSYHFRKMKANFCGVRKKYFGKVSRRQSICSKGWLQAKVCLKKHLPVHRFRTLRKWFFVLRKKTLAKCHKCNLRVHGNSLMKIFVWKFLVFLSFFGHFEIIFRPLAESFSKPLSALLFNCPEEHFEEIVFWEKNLFFLYLQRAKKVWQFVA